VALIRTVLIRATRHHLPEDDNHHVQKSLHKRKKGALSTPAKQSTDGGDDLLIGSDWQYGFLIQKYLMNFKLIYEGPTTAAWVRARVWSCGICGGQSGTGAGFLRVLRFPLPIFIPPIAPQSSSSIIWGLYKRPEVATEPSGLSPTPLIKKIYIYEGYSESNLW
jgi:hypothetical protein